MTQPNKNLMWSDEAKFEITGREFEALINIVRSALMTKEAQQVLMLAEANKILEAKLLEGIKTGVVIEQPLPNREAPVPQEVVTNTDSLPSENKE